MGFQANGARALFVFLKRVFIARKNQYEHINKTRETANQFFLLYLFLLLHLLLQVQKKGTLCKRVVPAKWWDIRRGKIQSRDRLSEAITTGYLPGGSLNAYVVTSFLTRTQMQA